MRKLFVILLAISLVGCAGGPVPLPVENLAVSSQVQLSDLRPKAEGTREIFSLLITSDQYGYQRVAQDLTDPTGPRLFAHRLAEKYSPQPAPATTLHHFAVYMNNRSELRSMALGAAFGGVIGAALTSGTVNRDGDTVHTLVNADSFAALSGVNEYKRAFYDEKELKAGTSAFIVFIESETAAGRRFTRTVTPMAQKADEKRVPLHRALESAIGFHLSP